MNNFYTKLIYASIFLLCYQVSSLSAQDEKLISSKKMLKDFDRLEKVIEAHPDPYTHFSEKAFKSKFEEVKATLDQPLSTLDFYKKVASIVALIKDGHTATFLPAHWLQNLRKEEGVFPYEVYLTNQDELYVIKNWNNGKIPVGSKILKINGITVDSFLNRIDPYISYETKNFRNTIIDGSIDQYLRLAFGYTDQTVIDYFTSDKEQEKVENMPYKEWKKIKKKNREERDIQIAVKRPYSYKKIAKGVGLINIYQFMARDLKSYDIFLFKTFKEISKDSVHSLIIDVRGNFGGWPKIASRLFHQISDTHFKTMAQSSIKISSVYRDNLLKNIPAEYVNKLYFGQLGRHYLDMDAITRDPIGSYVNEEAFFNESPITETNEFRGDCYLLINRDSYSAASSFASTFQCYQMGTIIGEETGGTKIFRANAIFEKLNKSGIRVRMSTTKLYTTCYNQELESIQPDIKFTPSILQRTSDMDMQLLFTQRIIKKKQKQKALAKANEE